MIRPGIPCWIVRCDWDPQWVGRVVLTGRRVRMPEIPQLDGQWEIFAHWLPSWTPCWYARSACLKPMYGPDVELANDFLADIGIPPCFTIT